jgi:prefoldin subunit 5
MPGVNLLKKKRIWGVGLVFMASAVIVFAADNKNIPPWMENIDNGGRSTYLIPKGAKRKVFGSQVIVETPNEYVARRLYEMEEYLNGQFAQIDEAQQELRKELEDLQKEVKRLAEREQFVSDLEDLKRTVEELKEFKAAAEESRLRLEEAAIAPNG